MFLMDSHAFLLLNSVALSFVDHLCLWVAFLHLCVDTDRFGVMATLQLCECLALLFMCLLAHLVSHLHADLLVECLTVTVIHLHTSLHLNSVTLLVKNLHTLLFMSNLAMSILGINAELMMLLEALLLLSLHTRLLLVCVALLVLHLHTAGVVHCLTHRLLVGIAVGLVYCSAVRTMGLLVMMFLMVFFMNNSLANIIITNIMVS